MGTSVETADLLRRAHNHTLVVPTASHYLLNGGKAAGNAVVGVDASGQSIVIGAVDRHRPAKTSSVSRCSRDKIQALKITAFLSSR